MFVDQINVTLRAGKGGSGCISFRRERGVPRGGPNGGRGGDGGCIYLESTRSVNSLAFYRYHPINKAKRGRHGEGSNRQGKRGEDLILKVPVGTIVKPKGSDTILFDFITPGQRYLAAKGGKGGLGNASYASSTHQAPRYRQEGRDGEEIELTLELKLIADIGLVGFPNAGKSTLISRLSAAKPLIAAYPFTTLAPNLGVVDIDEMRSFTIADIPGLIEGAHEGLGLGVRFLKHIERTRLLAHVIDVSPYSERDPELDFHTVMKELNAFNPDLASRRQILVANKIDLLPSESRRMEGLEKLAAEKGMPFIAVSALKTIGLKSLLAAMIGELDRLEDEGS